MKLNKQLIEKLANGEITVDNSECKLELLKAVLKEAFPKDHSIPQGLRRYYRKHGVGLWIGHDFTILPTVPLSDFLEEEFVLPEKWCIEVTDENRDILNNYRINIKKYSITPITYKYMYKDGSGDSFTLFYAKEITFKQFLKYILKQETMEKEIIGYKLIKEYPNSKSLGYFEKYTTGKLSQYPEYWQPVYKEEFQAEVDDWVTCKEGFLESDSEYAKKENKAGLGYKSNKTFQIGKIYPSSNSGNVVFPKGYGKGVYLFALRKATKEEIEKASEQIVSMNGKFNLTVKNKKVFHKNEDITDYIEEIGTWWKNVMLEGNLKFAKNYDFLIPSHNIKIMKSGCQSQETYLSDWLKVYNLIK